MGIQTSEILIALPHVRVVGLQELVEVVQQVRDLRLLRLQSPQIRLHQAGRLHQALLLELLQPTIQLFTSR